MPAAAATESWLSTISTLKVFLMVNVVSARSTAATFGFGSGVNKVLSEDGASSVVRTSKSVTLSVDAGKNPLAIPETVATPSIVTFEVPTLVTLATIGSTVSPAVVSVYLTKSFSLTTVPGNRLLPVVIVLTPPDLGLMVAIPTTNLLD